MRPLLLVAATLGAAILSACATAPGPVEVTRFHDAARIAQIGRGAIFVETAPGEEVSGLELAPYKAAVMRELAGLGYRESSRAEADQIAQIQLHRFVSREGGNRGPVSVGVGGSTGSYGSGVGLGIGINLGGGSKETMGTVLAVAIKDKASGDNLWEGRAQFSVSEKSDLARADTNAQTIASALFRGFPGGNGETVKVGVK